MTTNQTNQTCKKCVKCQETKELCYMGRCEKKGIVYFRNVCKKCFSDHVKRKYVKRPVGVNRLNQATIAKLKEYFIQGITGVEIAKELGCSKWSIYRYKRMINEVSVN